MSRVSKVPLNQASVVVTMAALATFVLSIAVMGGISAERLASDLAPRLRGQVTVVVWGHGLESADAAAARAAELLNSQPGIHRVEVLEGDERDALIGAVVDGPSHGPEAPRLISMDAPQQNDKILGMLARHRLSATINDRRGTGGILETKTWTIAGLGLVLSFFLIGGFVATCFVAGLAEIRSGTPRIELMMRLGAEPSLIEVIVSRGLVGGVFGGAIFGASCAILCLLPKIPVHSFPGSLAALVLSRMRFSDFFWLALCPATMTLLGAATASLGVRGGIARRERDL